MKRVLFSVSFICMGLDLAWSGEGKPRDGNSVLSRFGSFH